MSSILQRTLLLFRKIVFRGLGQIVNGGQVFVCLKEAPKIDTCTL